MSEEHTIEGAFDGPRALTHVGDETHWRVSRARAAAEMEAREKLIGESRLVTAIERRGDVLVFTRLKRGDLAEVIELVGVGESMVLEITPRAFFEKLGGPVDASRALARIGLPRSRVDRFLDRSRTLHVLAGVDLGGVMPSALWRSSDGPVAISVRHGRRDGWPVLDLASIALHAELDLRDTYVARGGDAASFDLALLHQVLRELTVERHEARRELLRERARSIVEQLMPREPSRVTLSVVAPSFLSPSLFAPVGDVESHHARRILRDWDGLAVGGEVVRVRTDPELARPPRLFAFEPRSVRRVRLFSKFDAGIAYDDEGLYSATPEALADRIAHGLDGVVVDATCGIGSITIALAKRGARVIAIDRDAERVRMGAHNAGIYGVADRIEFRVGDALAIVPTLRFDALVIDPPWGGRDYDRDRVTFDDFAMPIAPLLDAPRVVLKLPRSFDVNVLPPGFAIEAGIDARGVLKMLIARRGLP